jgi:hypothetical protein
MEALMPQWKLLTPHTSPQNQQYLEAGTIVGDGTPYPWVDTKGNALPPSLAMVGMDEDSQRAIDEHYDDNVRNDPYLPKLQSENTFENATDNMTQNKPNPNVSPAQTPPTQTRNESTVPPLRRGPVGASPAEPAKAPRGGQEGLRNPLDLGASPAKPERE